MTYTHSDALPSRPRLGVLFLGLALAAFGCDTTEVVPPDPGPEPTEAPYAAPAAQLPDVFETDPATGETRRVVSSEFLLEDGAYLWTLALTDPSGTARDTLRLEGPARLTGPVLVLGDDAPIFGLVSENAVRLYARDSDTTGELATDRDWVFLAPGASNPADPSFDDADPAPALRAALRAVDGRTLPVVLRSFGRGKPDGGRELVIDSLRAGALTLADGRYQVDVTYTRHSNSDLGDGEYSARAGGRAYGAGDVVVLLPDSDSPFCGFPRFALVRDGALTVRRPCLGASYGLRSLVEFTFGG